MKQICLTVIILFSFLVNNAQQMSKADKEEYNELRKKSKDARTTGIILVSSGGGMLIAGYILGVVGLAEDITSTDAYGYQTSSNDGKGRAPVF